MNIQDTVALVTGANRGLGRAIAEALVAAGARKVYAAARDPASISIPGVQAVKLDVTKPEQVAAAAETLGDVNVVINNAGIGLRGALLEKDSIEKARAEFETNFYGPWALSEALAPTLARNGGGAIVNVLSALTWVTHPVEASYSASKSAAWSLTNGLRNALRAQGTQVVGVHVGYMDTDMVRDVDAPKTNPADVATQIVEALRAGAPEVLADEVSKQIKASMSSDQAAYLTYQF